MIIGIDLPAGGLNRVLIAWTNTREAARAIAEALPFLRAATETEIIGRGAPGEAGQPRL
jgi:hypothetical protein